MGHRAVSVHRSEANLVSFNAAQNAQTGQESWRRAVQIFEADSPKETCERLPSRKDKGPKYRTQAQKSGSVHTPIHEVYAQQTCGLCHLLLYLDEFETGCRCLGTRLP